MPTETKKSKMTDQEYFELFANICTNSYSEEKSVNNPLNEDWQKLKLAGRVQKACVCTITL